MCGGGLLTRVESETPLGVTHGHAQHGIHAFAWHVIAHWVRDVTLTRSEHWEMHAVYSADLSLPYPTSRRRAELCLQHLELGHVLQRELDLDHLIDSVHNEPDALVHVVGREVVDELQVLDVTSCQVAQRACQLGLLRDQLTPLGYPRLVLVLDLEKNLT